MIEILPIKCSNMWITRGGTPTGTNTGCRNLKFNFFKLVSKCTLHVDIFYDLIHDYAQKSKLIVYKIIYTDLYSRKGSTREEDQNTNSPNNNKITLINYIPFVLTLICAPPYIPDQSPLVEAPGDDTIFWEIFMLLLPSSTKSRFASI